MEIVVVQMWWNVMKLLKKIHLLLQQPDRNIQIQISPEEVELCDPIHVVPSVDSPDCRAEDLKH